MSGGIGIGIFAPAGYVLDGAGIERARDYFLRRGHRVIVDPTCRGRHQRFSAPDAERAEALHRLARDPAVDLILAARGGYGSSRLLPLLDYAALARSDKLLAGHSDTTALSIALLATQDVATLAGPTAVFDFGGEAIDAFTEANFWRALEAGDVEVTVTASSPIAGQASGRLWGGNLALVAHLVGSRYFPAIDGGLLFLEDVYEPPYRIERMLLQLFHAGVLARQSAVILGAFSGYRRGEIDDGFDLETVVDYLRSLLPVPVVTGLPFGHIATKISLPVGMPATLEIGRDSYRLRYPGFALAGRRAGSRRESQCVRAPQDS